MKSKKSKKVKVKLQLSTTPWRHTRSG